MLLLENCGEILDMIFVMIYFQKKIIKTYFFIYSCNVDKKEIYKPTIKQVPDVDLTHELWLLKNTRFVLEKKIWFKALAGDKSDNIPGVKGVGDESAKKLISKYLTIESLYEDIQIKGPDIENRWKEELDLRKGYYKKLIAEKDNAFLSKKLATIKTDIQLGYQLEDFICPTNWEKFDQQFKKYEMSSLRVELAKMQ